MPTATQPTRLRIVRCRPECSKAQTFSRPSLLDWQLRGDISVLKRGPRLYGVCVNNYPLAFVSATRLDLPSLNQQVWHLRHRWPRPDVA